MVKVNFNIDVLYLKDMTVQMQNIQFYAYTILCPLNYEI